MTHSTVLVRFEGNIENSEKVIAKMLAPFDENKEVLKYKKYLRKREVKDVMKHFGLGTSMSPSGIPITDCKLTPKLIKEYFGHEGGEDKRGYFYWSTYNKLSKWDWFQIGGRWNGMLKLKKNAKGLSGERSLLDEENKGKPLGTDVAYLKDVDFEGMRKEEREKAMKDWDDMIETAEVRKDIFNYFIQGVKDGETIEEYAERNSAFATHAILDDKGWHEPSKMGWWGITYDHAESEETWNAKFAERFLSSPTDKTVIAIVDVHI